MDVLLKDFTSRDPQRIVAAARAVIWTRDAQILDRLADKHDLIDFMAMGVDLGGGFFLYRKVYFDFALQKLKYYRDQMDCLCHLYRQSQLFDPEGEAAAGHVRIEDVSRWGEGYIDGYTCACTLCGARYEVGVCVSHTTWYAWTPAPAVR